MKKDDYNSIAYGQILKEIRQKNHYTQEQVSQLTGFDTKYISRIENGQYIGPISTMLKFCEAYRVTPNDILCNFVKESEANKELESFDVLFSKLNKRDRQVLYSVAKSLLENQ